MVVVRWLPVLLIAGCYDPSASPVCESTAACTDAGSDGPTQVCAGDPSGLLPVTCFDPPPAPRTFPAGVAIMTSTDCDVPLVDHPDLCILAGESITFTGAGKVVAQGTRPLVLWSATTITIPAGLTLDVGTHDNGTPGPGANDVECPAVDGSANTASTPNIGSGGCGGPFGAPGGKGGAGALADTARVQTECSPFVVELDRIRGGCRGGHGGLSNVVGSLNGGSSGGAVYLMAASSITIKGTIDACGTGGNLANANNITQAGGGGGGSGGMIAFDTPSLVLDGARLVALAGGGSSGSGLDMGTVVQGVGGQNPQVSPLGFASATSSIVNDNFGGGGTMLAGDTAGDVVVTNTGGGGGGGGGAGYIRRFPMTTPVDTSTSTLAPPFTAP
jgi:hypothetical protein